MKVAPSPGKPGAILEREALILQMLDHPGIPRSRRSDFFTFTPKNSAALNCLVMEFIEGESLEAWATRNGHATQQQILDWLYQMADILKALHELELIHCDIKPDNIICKPDGQLVLVDFGATALLSEGRSTLAMGTVRYMAPEQADGTPVLQSDLFALGRTMIRMAAGVPLHVLSKDSQTGLLNWRHLGPHIDWPVAELLDQMASPTMGMRPRSVQALVGALEQMPEQIGRWQQQVKRLQRRRALRSKPAIALYGLLAIGLGFLLVQGGKRYLADLNYRWGLQDQGVGLFEASLPKFRFSLWLHPRAEVYDSLGLSCQQLGDNICAVKAFSDALDRDKSLWSAHYHLGSLYEDQLGMDEEQWVRDYQQGTLEEQPLYDLAEEHYRLAIQYGPRNMALAIINLARLMNLVREYHQAARLARQGLKQTDNPLQQASLYKNLGWAEFGMKDYKAARPYLEQSIALANDRADAFCLLAQVDTALGEPTQAKRAWQSCLLLNSENPEVRFWRNQVLSGLF